MTPKTSEVTRLLKAWGAGDQGALDRLTPLVYGELHRIAGQCMRGENPGNSLQATVLVNEAYLRLGWQDRAHFFAIAARPCAGFWWTPRGHADRRSAAAACSG